MRRPGFPAECDRARAWISQALDEELPELRRASLRAHLRACTDCSTFAAEIGTAAALLRAAPLLQPGRAPEPVPARAAVRLVRRPGRVAAGAASAVAAAALVGAVVGRTTQPQSTPATAAASAAATQAPYIEQYLLAMLTRAHYRPGRAIAT